MGNLKKIKNDYNFTGFDDQKYYILLVNFPNSKRVNITA